MNKLRDLMVLLIEDKPLPPEYKDHPLKENWRHHRDTHIEPDWLLIYKPRKSSQSLLRWPIALKFKVFLAVFKLTVRVSTVSLKNCQKNLKFQHTRPARYGFNCFF
jgi:hypothetical protein